MIQKILRYVLFWAACMVSSGAAIADDWVKIVSPTAGQTWSSAAKYTIHWQNSILLPKGVTGALSLLALDGSGKVYVSESVPLNATGTGSLNVTIWGIIPPGDYRLMLGVVYPPELCGTATPCTKGVQSIVPIRIVAGNNLLSLVQPKSGSLFTKYTRSRITWTYNSLLFPPSPTYGVEPRISVLQCFGAGCDAARTGTILIGGAYAVDSRTAPSQVGVNVTAGGWDYDYRVGSVGPSQIALHVDNYLWINSAPVDVFIEQPSLKLISPKAGDKWALGSNVNIAWQYHTAVPGKRLDITLRNMKPSQGYVYPQSDPHPHYVIKSIDLAVTPGVTSGQGSFNWTIPGSASPSDDYRVMLTMNDAGAPNLEGGPKGITSDWLDLPVTGTLAGLPPVISNEGIYYRYEPEHFPGSGHHHVDQIKLPALAGKLQLLINAEDKSPGADSGINNVKAIWTFPDGRKTSETVCTYPAGYKFIACEQVKELLPNRSSKPATYFMQFVVETNSHAISSVSTAIILAPPFTGVVPPNLPSISVPKVPGLVK